MIHKWEIPTDNSNEGENITKKIVLGGGVLKAGDILLDPVKENFAKFATKIKLATLGNDEGVIDAAWLMKKTWFTKHLKINN